MLGGGFGGQERKRVLVCKRRHAQMCARETFVLHEQLDKITAQRACACITSINGCARVCLFLSSPNV